MILKRVGAIECHYVKEVMKKSNTGTTAIIAGPTLLLHDRQRTEKTLISFPIIPVCIFPNLKEGGWNHQYFLIHLRNFQTSLKGKATKSIYLPFVCEQYSAQDQTETSAMPQHTHNQGGWSAISVHGYMPILCMELGSKCHSISNPDHERLLIFCLIFLPGLFWKEREKI